MRQNPQIAAIKAPKRLPACRQACIGLAGLALSCVAARQSPWARKRKLLGL